MGELPVSSPEEFFSGHPFALEVFRAVEATVAGLGPCQVRCTASEVALRRRRNFAFVWMPGRYLARPGADVVVSIALGRRDPSPRFKEVAHPAPGQWIHHLEIHDLAEVDDEVAMWLAEAAERGS